MCLQLLGKANAAQHEQHVPTGLLAIAHTYTAVRDALQVLLQLL